jgi:ribosome-associated translation inhibitor RaiA
MTALHARDQQVAEQWVSFLVDGDLDSLLSLYTGSAPLHVARDVIVGRDEIRDFWEASPLLGGAAPERVTRANGVSVVRWPRLDGGIVPVTELLIRHGRIAEQWVGEAVLGETILGAIPLELSTSGAVSDGDRAAIVDVLEKVLTGHVDDVVHARVRLEHASDRNRVRPTTVRAVLDLKGATIRADVAADTARAAIDGLESRLRAQLRHRVERRADAHHRGPARNGSRRDGSSVGDRPAHYPRPPEERQIVRHKSVAPAWSSVEEALFDLRSMDYDFYLYDDAVTGRDAVVHRVVEPDGTYGTGHVVRFVDGPDDEVAATVPESVEIDPRRAPTLSAEEARERLDAGHEPWVLFVDRDSRRGHVLYRRYDGHYGLLVPIDEPDDGGPAA